MYLMTCTRPDLAYPLSLLARYVAHGRHRKVRWDAAKRVLRYLCSTSGMGLVLGGRDRVVLTGHADASWVDDLATQRSSEGYTFSLGSGSVSWRASRSSSVLSSSCEAEIYAGAMAAQELRWLTYLLTDLGEAPRSPPVLYVDNKAMLALCQEHRLEHRTKHIALRFFLARELEQRGQLRLAYVASQANTADVFTKALPPSRAQPWRPLCPTVTSAPAAAATATATAATAAPTYYTAMALLRVLAYDHEGRPIQFDTWLDDLQLYLQSDSKDSVSLFDLVSGAASAPPATADSSTRSQWLTRDAAARLAIRNHLPLAECAHFGQHRTRQALYDAVVARYSSPAIAALGRLLLPYLFPELSTFATVEDLVSHLRTSDARYRATVPAEFLDRNPPPMYITLYFIVTRLPDSLRSVMDHFLSLDPTSLTVDLLEQHLLTAETSADAVGAARGTPRPPFFEGCSPSPLAPSYASASAADVSVPEDVGAASASAKRRSSNSKGGRGGGGGSGGGGGGSGSGGGGSSGGGGGGGSGGGSGGSSGGGGGSGGSGGSGDGGTGGGGTGARHVGSGGGHRQQQQRRSETLSPQQLREWFLRGPSGGSCPYVIRTGDRAGQTCGRLHTQHRCFSCLDYVWRAEFGDDIELPRWADLLKSRIAIFDLDFDAILSAMYALCVRAEGDCYRCVPPNPGIAAAALGASESGTLPGIAPAEALHTFTLDSGASRCFFRDSTTLTPLPAPIPVRLADPSGRPVVARSSTVLPCPAVPSGSLSGLHLPSFSTNLVSTAALQDAMVTTTTPRGQRVSICTCTRTGRHLATFTHQPGSSQVAASCSCRLLSHQTLLWHHRLGHPSLHCLRGMHSRLLVSGLPRSLPPLPPSPAPPCLPCVEGQQRAPPHSLFPPTTAPLQTLHMDVWGPARVSGQSRERYFLLVVDDYTRYTTVIPLRSKGQIVDVLIPWIRTVRLQLRERFGQDLPVLRLHFDRGGEFSSNLLTEFCRGEGILQSFTLPDSPQQNGIAERRIGLVMEVARTSMIRAAAPHFLWTFAVQYAAHQLNLWPRVSLPETSPTLRWTGEVGDASVFRVWGSRAFVRDTSANKLSPRAIPCVFLGFVPDAPGWQFYHPTSRHFLPSQDVTLDESVPFYRLFPYRSTPPPPPPLFLAPGPPPVDPLPPRGPAPSGVSQVDPLPGPAPVQVAVGSGAPQGAASEGAESGGAEPGGAGSEGAEAGGAEPGGVGTGGVEPGGAEPEGVEPGGAASEGAESGGAEPLGAASSGGSARASPRLSPQQLREWFVRHVRLRSGATGAGGAGAGGAGVAAGASGAGGAAATGPGGARTQGTGAAGTGTGAGGTGAVDPCAGGAGGTVRPRPYFVPLLQQPASPLPAPSPYTEQSDGLTQRREPASRPASPVRTGCRVPRPRPPPVPGTHAMALLPSSVPLHVHLPPPPESSLPALPDPESYCAHAASPTVSRLLATIVTDPSFESTAASALVGELVDFAAACRLDYATALVAKSKSASPASVDGECALGSDVFEDRQEDFECHAAAVPCFASMLLAPEGDPDAPDIPTPRSYAEAITGPYSSQWKAAMDAEMASSKSTGTYVDAVPPSRANIVDGMWIFRVKRPPGSPPTFKARYVARGFTTDFGDRFECLAAAVPRFASMLLAPEGDPDAPDIPTPRSYAEAITGPYSSQWKAAMDAEMASSKSTGTYVDAVPPSRANIVDGMWIFRVKRPPGSPPTFKARYVARGFSTQWSLRRPVYGLRQVPREWHNMLRTTLAALGFTPSTADPSLFLRTDTSLPPFYVLVYVDNLVFANANTEALTLVKSELKKRHTCTDLGELRSYLGLQITRDRAGAPSH
ncbi:unnamed protein product [Closterium sp. NIES-54]